MALPPDYHESDQSLSREQLNELKRNRLQEVCTRAEAGRTRYSTVRDSLEDSAQLELALR